MRWNFARASKMYLSVLHLTGCAQRETIFFFNLAFENAFLGRQTGAQFLSSAFKVLGDCNFHLSFESVAERLNIVNDENMERSAAVRLAFEMRYAAFLVPMVNNIKMTLLYCLQQSIVSHSMCTLFCLTSGIDILRTSQNLRLRATMQPNKECDTWVSANHHQATTAVTTPLTLI